MGVAGLQRLRLGRLLRAETWKLGPKAALHAPFDTTARVAHGYEVVLIASDESKALHPAFPSLRLDRARALFPCFETATARFAHRTHVLPAHPSPRGPQLSPPHATFCPTLVIACGVHPTEPFPPPTTAQTPPNYPSSSHVSAFDCSVTSLPHALPSLSAFCRSQGHFRSVVDARAPRGPRAPRIRTAGHSSPTLRNPFPPT